MKRTAPLRATGPDRATVKLRKCKASGCAELFMPRSTLHKACSVSCAVASVEASNAKVMAKAKSISYLISRTVSRTRPPSLVTIRTLCNTLLRSCVSYGLQFWRPTQAQFKKLNSLYFMPLRRCLSLPLSSHQMSLAMECNTVPLDLYRMEMISKTILRFYLLPPTHPTRIMFLKSRDWHHGHPKDP